MRQTKAILAALSFLLAACGGGQSSEPPINPSGTTRSGNSDPSTDIEVVPALSDFSINGFEVRRSVDPGSIPCADRIDISGDLDVVGQAGPQLRFTREPITNLNVAFVRATFSDTPEVLPVPFPSVSELETVFLAADSRLQSYFDDVSYGQFVMSGEFVADIELPVRAEYGGRATESSDFGAFDISIPNFSEDAFDLMVLIVISDYARGVSSAGSIYSPDGLQFTINGARLENLCGVLTLFGHVGHNQRDLSYPAANDFEDFTTYVALPGTENEDLEVVVPLSDAESTFVHELIHALGIKTHAYSSTNGDRVHSDPEVEGNQDFLWRDYGNRYDIMGTREYSFGLNAGYRELLGWIGDDRTVRIDEAVDGVVVTLQPLDSREGNVLAEVRLPGRYFLDDPILAALERTENQGYLFEVWPSNNPYYWFSDVGLTGGAGGLVLHRSDGFTSSVLDASPSPNIDYSWGTDYDLSDIAMRAGQVFDDGVIRVENLEVHDDGSVSFELTVSA